MTTLYDEIQKMNELLEENPAPTTHEVHRAMIASFMGITTDEADRMMQHPGVFPTLLLQVMERIEELEKGLLEFLNVARRTPWLNTQPLINYRQTLEDRIDGRAKGKTAE